MRFSLGSELTYEASENATLILNIEAMRCEQQTVLSEALDIEPFVEAEAFTAPDTGNRFLRLLLPAGEYKIRYRAEVELNARHDDPAAIREVPVSRLPLEVLPYLNPSRYCLSDELGRFAGRQFGDAGSGHERVAAICNWIYDEVDYVSLSSDPSTTAKDTFTTRAGVCRDFAHLGITFCRALGIPARFVSCYAFDLDPPDFHAVFEAFVGGRWYLFDATRKAALDGLVRIGYGRDAADAAFATIYGPITSKPMTIWIKKAGTTKDKEPWTTDAISVAAV